MVTKKTELTELFEIACTVARDIVQSGEKFIVRDLFRCVEWHRVSRALRTKLGSMFYVYTIGEAKGLYEPLGKTPQHQQIYAKK